MGEGRIIRAVPDDHLGHLDQLLYLTAAMTGMRKGELQALRWMDVDWRADGWPKALVRGGQRNPHQQTSSSAPRGPTSDRQRSDAD